MRLDGPVFLFLFFPAVFCLHFLIPEKYGKARNILLLAASLCFLCFGDPLALLLLLFAAFCCWGSGMLMRTRIKFRGLCCALGVTGCLVPMLVFRYADFFAEALNGIGGLSLTLPGMHLPLGIAFFTLQGISYLADVCRGRAEAEKNYFRLLLWLSFFPQLISGPIVRWREFDSVIDTRKCTAEGVVRGMRRMICGLAKKLLLADTLGLAVSAAFSAGDTLSLPLAWLGAFCFLLQIFCDLSGYSDMAVGLGQIFGITLPENFDHPYAAGSLGELWRRWQITVSAWFRDYIYIPLGGSRKGAFRALLCKWLVWICAGLWYIPGWCGLIGGVFSGLLMTIETLAGSGKKRRRKRRKIHWYQHLYTWIAAALIFVLLRADDLAGALTYYRAMFTGVNLSMASFSAAVQLLTPMMLAAILCAILLPSPAAEKIGQFFARKLPRFTQIAASLITLALLIACILSAAGAVHPAGFFYRF